MSRFGRPRALDKRQHRIKITFTASERALLQALAEAEYIPVSTWMRQEVFRAIDAALA